MDLWITGIQDDRSGSSPSEKVVANKPASLNDACWDNTGDERIKIDEELTANNVN